MTYYVNKNASLTPEARAVICDQATEHPFSGDYNEVVTQGSYVCRRCGLALFRANSQFSSGCGWPSFDLSCPDAVRETRDADGRRTEITCARCKAHLGHVFEGEYFTPQNRRHCVNSLSLDFVHDDKVVDTGEAIVAGGCFWGVEYYLKALPGVLHVESGYIGGDVDYPSYDDVCRGNSGHYEAVRVLFDDQKTDYHKVLKRFFEIHDPTQADGQGADRGLQYQSAIFYYDDSQKTFAAELIEQLQHKGFRVATKLFPVQAFWKAEEGHQNYYQKHRGTPYCHKPINRFD